MGFRGWATEVGDATIGILLQVLGNGVFLSLVLAVRVSC